MVAARAAGAAAFLGLAHKMREGEERTRIPKRTMMTVKEGVLHATVAGRCVAGNFEAALLREMA
jgi:hypothetical protein